MEDFEKYEIFLLGSEQVGKTQFINKIRFNKFDEEYIPTINFVFFCKNLTINGEEKTIIFYDMTGNNDPKYKYLRIQTIKRSKAIFIMYDITNDESFRKIDEWMSLLKEINYTNIPIMILGNKLDLEKNRLISTEEGKKMAEKYGVLFNEISCYNETNINNFVIELVSKFVKSNNKTNKEGNLEKNKKIKKVKNKKNLRKSTRSKYRRAYESYNCSNNCECYGF